jgi:sigma-B regulation protein RsbQ
MQWILLPGFDGTGMLFEPFLQALPSGIVPVVVIYPRERICSANELLEIVLSNLPQNEPYVLLAESFSGPIAMKVSTMHKIPPVALILCASFATRPVSYISIMLARFWCALIGCHLPRWLVRRYLLGNATSDIVSLFYRAISNVSTSVLTSRFTVLLEFGKEYAPKHLKSPLLYLQATKDRLVGTHNATLLQQSYPHMSVEKIESPHLILQVQPKASIRTILDFLEKLSPTASNASKFP